MKTLIISDTHIGDPRLKNSDKIAELLSGHFDQIILAGDIVDTWVDGQKITYNNPMIDALRKSKARVVWVLGNHDFDIDTFEYIPNAIPCEVFDFIDNVKIRVVHGHQVYAFGNMAWYSRLYTKFDVWLYNITKGRISLQNLRKLPSYKNKVSRKRNEILKLFGNDTEIIIMGHTHIRGHQSDGNKDIYDNGSTMLAGNYIIIENGSVYFKNI